MSGRSLVRGLLVVVAVAVTIGTVSNVFLDDAAVRAKAARVACGAAGCAGGPTRIERTPIAERLELVTRDQRTVEVVCTRRALLFGSYECVREAGE